MTNRGFLKTVGGHTRMRFVKPGFDANDPDVPSNSVIFDSDVDGMASILEVGEGSVPISTPGAWLRQWDYEFVPLCVFSFLENNTNNYWDFTQWCALGIFPHAMPRPRITVSKQGIWVRRGTYNSTNNPTIRWVAYRISAYG